MGWDGNESSGHGIHELSAQWRPWWRPAWPASQGSQMMVAAESSMSGHTGEVERRRDLTKTYVRGSQNLKPNRENRRGTTVTI